MTGTEVFLAIFIFGLICMICYSVANNIQISKKIEAINESDVVLFRVSLLDAAKQIFGRPQIGQQYYYGIPVKMNAKGNGNSNLYSFDIVVPYLKEDSIWRAWKKEPTNYNYFNSISVNEIIPESKLDRHTRSSYRKSNSISNNFEVMKRLSSFVREDFQLQSEIKSLKSNYRDIEKLTNLILSSELHADQVSTYTRLLNQINVSLSKAKQLRELNMRIIREILIEGKVTACNPDTIPDAFISLDARYRTIKEEFQDLKENIKSYHELLNQSKGIR